MTESTKPHASDALHLGELLSAKRGFKGQMPVAQSLRSTYVTLFNVPPSGFSFYQNPPLDAGDPLTQDQLRGAFNFEGHCSISSTVNVVDGSRSRNLTSLTIEFWVNTSSSSSSTTLFKILDTHGSYVQLSNPSNLRVTWSVTANSSTNGSCGDSAVSISDGQWHHVALVLADNPNAAAKPSVTATLYVDTRVAQLSNSSAMSGYLTDGFNLYAGNVGTSTGSSTGIVGSLGQVRVWKTARSLSQIVTCAGTSLQVASDSDLSLNWSDAVDLAQKRVYDSSPKQNTGTITLPSQAPDPWWSLDATYGALADATHLSFHPVNMSGSLSLDRFQHQRVQCSSGHLSLDQSATALTVEMWVQADSDNHNSATLFAMILQDGSGNPQSATITNPGNLTLSWGSHIVVSNQSVTDGAWHHLAFVWDWRTTNAPTWALYIDAVKVNMSASAWVPGIGTAPSLLLGGDGGSNSERYVSGNVAEFRVWQSARSAAEVHDDAAYRVAAPPPELRLYWPFARDFTAQNLVEDFSAYDSTGAPKQSPSWRNDLVYGVFANHMLAPPTPAASGVGGTPAGSWSADSVSPSSASQLLGAAAGFPPVAETDLRQAFIQAQASGYFDKRYFPNIHGVNSDREHRHAKAAIVSVDVQVFIDYWKMGRRLDLVKRHHGHYAHRFIPAPTNSPTARLMLVETYRMSAYMGDVVEGPVVRTFTLMPGESTSFSVSTYKDTTSETEAASSVFDSLNESSEASFESSLATDQNSSTSEAAELSFYADASVKQRWGTGNASVNSGGTIEGDLSHQSFFQQTTNAIANHAASASSARNVEIDTSYTVTEASGQQTALSREIRNVNSSRTLDLVFRQLAQEYEAILHLTDVRVGYYDPNPGSFRAVSLAQLDSLLDQVMVDNPAQKLAAKQAIVAQVLSLTAMAKGIVQTPLVRCSSKSTGLPLDLSSVDITAITTDQVFSVDCAARTDFEYAYRGSSVSVQVPGLVMGATAVSLRTDNVVAEAVIGKGIGLDAFALGLQAQQLRRSAIEAEMLKAEADKLRLANDIVSSGDTAKAALYAQVFPPPRINNNVMYADETGRTAT